MAAVFRNAALVLREGGFECAEENYEGGCGIDEDHKIRAGIKLRANREGNNRSVDQQIELDHELVLLPREEGQCRTQADHGHGRGERDRRVELGGEDRREADANENGAAEVGRGIS